MVVLRPGSGKITCWMRNCALFASVTSTTSIYASRRVAVLTSRLPQRMARLKRARGSVTKYSAMSSKPFFCR